MIGQELGVSRLHTGYRFALDNRAAFFGLDRTFDLSQTDLSQTDLSQTRLTPRLDITQIEDQDQRLASRGSSRELTKHIAIKSWV